MIQYPEKTRQEAIRVFNEKGIQTACERFHVPKSSIYRWRRKERQKSPVVSKIGESNESRPNHCDVSASSIWATESLEADQG